MDYSNNYIQLREYRDQQFGGDHDEQNLLKESCTLDVENLSFYTTEEQMYELFSRCGDVKNVFMGLDKIKKTACGFCFVEYHNRFQAKNAMWCLNGTRLHDTIIHTDWALGFGEGRQYGCRRCGGHVRDASHEDFNAGREGFGEACDRRGIH
uniref:Nuclear cap-binding protein subunit 2 n=1 Tax=Suricata suricatta TaxID=37032 RepID=A0A673UIW0_SURSU